MQSGIVRAKLQTACIRARYCRLRCLQLRHRYLARATEDAKGQKPVSTPSENPDFDSFELNDDYYKEIGITPEQAAEQLEEVWNVDPDGFRVLDEGVAEKFVEDSDDEGEIAPYGPPALLLAGFRDHELSMVRVTLDSVGGHSVKVIPCLGPVLYARVADAVHLPEPNWEEPKPENQMRSGDWGSQRTILFSGLSEEDVLTVLDLLEEAGLPTLVVAIAERINASNMVGEVLAEAIKSQRGRKMVGVDTSAMVSELPDMPPKRKASESAFSGNLSAPGKAAGAELSPSGASERTTTAKPPKGSAVTKTKGTEELSRMVSEQEGPVNSAAIENAMVSDAAPSERPSGRSLKEAADLAADERDADSSPSSYAFALGKRRDRDNLSSQPEVVASGGSPLITNSTEQPRKADLGSVERTVPETQQSSREAVRGDDLRDTTEASEDTAEAPLQQAMASERPDSDKQNSGTGQLHSDSGSHESNDGKKADADEGTSQARKLEGGKETVWETPGATGVDGTSPEAVRDSFHDSGSSEDQTFEEVVKGAGKNFMANFEHNSFATQQRELRRQAAEEMQRRSKASRAKTAAGESLEAENLIDAVAAGEDLDSMLKSSDHANPGWSSKQPDDQTARQRMEEILQQLRASTADLPEDKKKKLADDLKVLESDQESVERVLSELGASLDNVPGKDRDVLKEKLREEAWQPTKHAIGAALACGISGEEIKAFVDQAEKDKAENRGGWYPTIASIDSSKSSANI